MPSGLMFYLQAPSSPSKLLVAILSNAPVPHPEQSTKARNAKTYENELAKAKIMQIRIQLSLSVPTAGRLPVTTAPTPTKLKLQQTRRHYVASPTPLASDCCLQMKPKLDEFELTVRNAPWA